MSDLTAAAAAMGLPESLVERSAEARATVSGQSVDEILAAWSGGEPAPAPTPTEPEASPEPAPSEDVSPEPEPSPAPAVIDVAIPDQPTPAPEPVPAGPYKPPVLVGVKDNPMAVLAGVVGLFFIVVMVGLVGPSIPTEIAGARTSDLPYTEAALDGQQIYQTTGCAACHTQMVRPVVADVGLGAVTLNDTNQVLGTRRFGPDLSNVGARITGSQIEATIAGLGDHPAHSLSQDDIANLVAYLVESQTMEEES